MRATCPIRPNAVETPIRSARLDIWTQGIEAGYATLGRIGFEGRFDYVALGRRRPSPRDSAPMLPQARRWSVSASFAATEEAVETAQVGSLELKGFGRPVVAYEVPRLRQPPA